MFDASFGPVQTDCLGTAGYVWGSQPNHLINGANSKEPQSQNNLAQSSPLPLAVLNINVAALSHKFFPYHFVQ